MVSNLVNVWAEGKLADFNMKAGVMMSGGTHQCCESRELVVVHHRCIAILRDAMLMEQCCLSDNIGERAQAQCKGCDPSEGAFSFIQCCLLNPALILGNPL